MTKKAILLCGALIWVGLWSCSGPQNLAKVTDRDSCTDKEGYWYNGQCWADFQEHGITAQNIDSVYTAQIKAIEDAYVSINDNRYSLDFFLPQEDEQMLVIASFDELEKNIILSFDPKKLEEKDFVAEASYLAGNIIDGPDGLEPQLLAAGKLDVHLTEDFDVTVSGSISSETGKVYQIKLFGNEAVMGAGTSKLKVSGNEAILSGTLGTITYGQIKGLIADHPEVKTIVLDQVAGSVNDDINMFTARLVRAAGLNTKVLSTSHIASGGVDFFAAGAERILTRGAKVGVHSWAGGDIKGDQIPKEHPAHQYQLAYFTLALGAEKGPDFYFYTLAAAPAEDIYYMSEDEIKQMGLSTKIID